MQIRFGSIVLAAIIAVAAGAASAAEKKDKAERAPYYSEAYRDSVGRTYYVYGYKIVVARPKNFDAPVDGFEYRPVRRGRF